MLTWDQVSSHKSKLLVTETNRKQHWSQGHWKRYPKQAQGLISFSLFFFLCCLPCAINFPSSYWSSAFAWLFVPWTAADYLVFFCPSKDKLMKALSYRVKRRLYVVIKLIKSLLKRKMIKEYVCEGFQSFISSHIHSIDVYVNTWSRVKSILKC